VDAVSAKAEVPAEPYLEELLDVLMIQPHHPGRYTLHDDLMRQYVRRLAEDTPGEQRPALTACSTATAVALRFPDSTTAAGMNALGQLAMTLAQEFESPASSIAPASASTVVT
jgi:hypothetical protein